VELPYLRLGGLRREGDGLELGVLLKGYSINNYESGLFHDLKFHNLANASEGKRSKVNPQGLPVQHCAITGKILPM